MLTATLYWTVATDAVFLRHQTINIYNVEEISIASGPSLTKKYIYVKEYYKMKLMFEQMTQWCM